LINQSFIIYEVVILNKNIFRLRLKNIFEREEKTSLILKNSLSDIIFFFLIMGEI